MRIEGSSLEMEMDGRQVCARLLVARAWFLEIELVEPFPSLRYATPNMPGFPRAWCQRFVRKCGELIDEGRRRARVLVEKLARAVRVVEELGRFAAD